MKSIRNSDYDPLTFRVGAIEALRREVAKGRSIDELFRGADLGYTVHDVAKFQALMAINAPISERRTGDRPSDVMSFWTKTTRGAERQIARVVRGARGGGHVVGYVSAAAPSSRYYSF